MAAPSTTHRLSAGRLVANPSNLATPAANCGGTVLGAAQSIAVKITRKLEPITAEEWGSEPVDAVLLGAEIRISGLFAGWDEDAVSALFYGGATGSGTPSLTFPQYGSPVEEGSKNAVLLWLPNDDANQPAFLAFNAVPWTIDDPIYFSGRRPLEVRASFLCLRNSTGNVFKSDLLTNLSL